MTVSEQIDRQIRKEIRLDRLRATLRRKAESRPRCGVCGGRMSERGNCQGDGLVRCGLWRIKP